MKLKKWIYIPAIIAVLIIAVILLPFDETFPLTDNLSVTTTSATTTATIKDEHLATTTTAVDATGGIGNEMTGSTTKTTANTSSLNKTELTTQEGSASTTKGTSVTKTTAKKTEATKTTATKTTTGKASYLDTSKLTGTQEDVGKVVGYSSWLDQDITVVRVEEKVNGTGLKGIEIFLSDYTCICLKVECQYCHGYPCPDGGDEQCSQYDVKLDFTKTCYDCGRPLGDGYNGTCHVTIDWENGGIHTCHHYD